MTQNKSQKSNALPSSSLAPSVAEVQVLVAEDSATIRYYLAQLINETPGLRVVGQARDGVEALRLVEELQPDVVSMDVRMPRMDGIEATRKIMSLHPTPVVIVSGLVQTEIDLSFQAIESGALAVVEKPPDRNAPLFTEKRLQLTRTLAAMSQVKVIRRTTKPVAPVQPERFTRPEFQIQPEVIAIGASAGGPSALSALLSQLPLDFPVPIVIAQHIPNEFVSGLARWLDKVTPLSVRVATDGTILAPGVVNLCPGTAHIQVLRKQGQLMVELDPEHGTHRYQPSVDVLFESVATACGDRAIGLVLTGMGDDGARGLLRMRQSGARTLAQDQRSSTVFGMPSAAIERGAVEEIVSLAALPMALLNLVPRTG
jgi:two-component system chemotaxis response regulator CheB